MEKNEPNYYAVIPANVRYANITANAKLLYGEITALSNKLGYCYATNEYFAKLYNVNKSSITRWITELVDNGFITREIVYKEDSMEIETRYLKIIVGSIKNSDTPILNNSEDNNTRDNNTRNNIISSAEAPKGQLINTGKKPKKPKMNGYIEVIQNLSSNEQIRNALLEYCNFRRGRGLTVKQWELIVTNFRKDSEGKTVDEVLKCIEVCLINGRNSLYYSDYQNNNSKPVPTAADDNPSVIRRSR